MSTEVVVAIVFGVVGVCGTVIGCTWKLAGKISALESAVVSVTKTANKTHLMVEAHTKECDVHRVKLDERLASAANRLDGLEGA